MTTLMIQGTTSDAGKSTLVAALCRCLFRRDVSVAPFKPQNMALNSAVTADGGEIGRAQALQAQAANLAPTTDMNPILLKPSSDIGAQVIIHGKSRGNMSATTYHDYKKVAMGSVLESHARLCKYYSVVAVEGAGSPAEINLRENDIANMGFAEAVDCPVILVADIDRGGVFAHLVGTLALLSETEQDRVKGFIINRFRGDIALLQPGLDWLEAHTGKPVLGVLPYLQGLHLDAEDALPRDAIKKEGGQKFKVIVPVLPRISNHTDFDPLRLHPDVDFEFIKMNQDIPGADLIILPGSKSVRSDLEFLRKNKWDKAINRHLRFGGKVFGICGGFQMLGQHINDELGIEGKPGISAGLGLLECETQLLKEKQLHNRTGKFSFAVPGEAACAVKGYEIHVGVTEGEDLKRPAIISEAGNDGAINLDDNVMGTYWHGLLDTSEALSNLLVWSGLQTEMNVDLEGVREAQIDRLADEFESNIDMGAVMALLSLPSNEVC